MSKKFWEMLISQVVMILVQFLIPMVVPEPYREMTIVIVQAIQALLLIWLGTRFAMEQVVMAVRRSMKELRK